MRPYLNTRNKTRTFMKTYILSLLTLILFTACSSAPTQDEKTQTLVDTKINAVKQAKETVNTLNEKTQAVQVQVAVSTLTPNGANLYAQKCASCHGKDAKKSALNVSAPIAGWSSKQTQDALNGYIAGTYGGKMKGLMQGQSKPLSQTDIILISDYISVL